MTAGLWGAGSLTCLACGEEHTGTWLVGSEPVECPECAEMMCCPTDGAGFGSLPWGEMEADVG